MAHEDPQDHNTPGKPQSRWARLRRPVPQQRQMVEFDHEAIYGEEEKLGKPVDTPADPKTVFASVVARTSDRQPIVPAWVRSAEQRWQLLEWAVRLGAHTTVYHLTRVPKYAWRLARWAPRGGWRLLRLWGGWVFDAEAAPLRGEAVKRVEFAAYSGLVRERNARVRTRLIVTAVVVVPIAIALVALWFFVPHWPYYAGIAPGVIVLGWAGRPIGRPVMDRVHVGPDYIKLTAEQTRAALVACGVGIKRPEDVVFVLGDIHRDGPGHIAVVDLPPGVIAEDVIKERAKLAGALRLPKTQVWPSQQKDEHPGRLRLWVADRPVPAMKTPAWPLLHEGSVDYFKPWAFGFDERLRPTSWVFAEKSSLFAGIPGSGKSLAERLLALAGALDPIVQLCLFELKGTGDFDVLEELCAPELFGSGADDNTKVRALRALRWLFNECEVRGPRIKKLVKAGFSKENKLNRAMAEKDPKLRPIVAIFDEVQELITDPEHGKQAEKLATAIIKRGRGLGIHLVFGTQRIDKPSIPRGISSNIAIRFCLAVFSHTESELVLGTGSYGRGARPSDFEPGPPPEGDSGWGYRAGYGPIAAMKAAYVDNEMAAVVVERAKAARGLAGTLATDVDVQTVEVDLLADLDLIWPEEALKVWSERLAADLAALRPSFYSGWGASQLGTALAALQLRTEQVWATDPDTGKGANRNGITRSALDAALAARQLAA